MLALVLVNGLFAGAEIAILSVRKTRLQQLVEAGGRRAAAIAYLREHPERFLATVQIGITVISATAAAFGGASVARQLTPWLLRVPYVADEAEGIALGIVVAGVSFLSLVLGELVPKSLALRSAETYAMIIGRPLKWLSHVAAPLVWVLTATSNLVLRVFGDSTTFIEARLSRDEIQQILEEATSVGTVDKHGAEIAARALEFSSLDVSSLMVPRPEIVSIDRRASVDDLAAIVLRVGHSRVLVIDGNLDEIVGFVDVREVLAHAHGNPAYTLEMAIRLARIVPETMGASAALRDLQERVTPLAVVVDEQGTVVGLVTIEDLVEELVGEIMNEGDKPRRKPLRAADGSLVVPARLAIHEANRDLDLELPESDAFSTLGGLVIEQLGRIPAVGDKVRVGAFDIEVTEASPKRVKTLRITPAPEPP